MKITKANGETQEFDPKKLKHSWKRAHIPEEYHDEIFQKLEPTLYEGITTNEIYETVTKIISALYPAGQCTYNLKHAIMALGPSGFPFERFVGEIFRKLGYDVEVGKMLQGRCVSHEVDVYGKKDDEHLLIECKYKSQAGYRTDVKIPLYISVRFQDVAGGELRDIPEDRIRKIVITNTRFTTEALTYGECVGLEMIGWDYPKQRGLRTLIEEVQLHPITSLSSLEPKHLKELLEKEIVFAMQLIEQPVHLDRLRLSDKHRAFLLRELEALKSCGVS